LQGLFASLKKGHKPKGKGIRSLHCGLTTPQPPRRDPRLDGRGTGSLSFGWDPIRMLTTPRSPSNQAQAAGGSGALLLPHSTSDERAGTNMHNPALALPQQQQQQRAQRRVQAASVGGGGGDTGKSAAARVLGSGAAGVMELALFHPVDTVAKRLMSYEVRVCMCVWEAGGRWDPGVWGEGGGWVGVIVCVAGLGGGGVLACSTFTPRLVRRARSGALASVASTIAGINQSLDRLIGLLMPPLQPPTNQTHRGG
jgi:hypothetical protein